MASEVNAPNKKDFVFSVQIIFKNGTEIQQLFKSFEIDGNTVKWKNFHILPQNQKEFYQLNKNEYSFAELEVLYQASQIQLIKLTYDDIMVVRQTACYELFEV